VTEYVEYGLGRFRDCKGCAGKRAQISKGRITKSIKREDDREY
jgi:hypothetical protein